MSDSENENERGFVVIDRRGRSGEQEQEAEQPTAQPERQQAPPQAGGQASAPELPPIDFSSFVHSIAISALYHLGLVTERESGKPATPNWELARQNIDILEMLQEKTRGNLDPDETRLLEGLLFDLRMRFVETKRGPAP